jgi:RNA polymerase sigma-70 factor (ECF subfamily)
MSATVREALQAAVARRWPDLEIDPELAAACVAQPRAAELGDLYLSKAAGRGDAWALRELEALLSQIAERLRRRWDQAHAAEAVQAARERLLMGAKASSGYAGKGSLKAWLTVIAAHQMASLHRQGHQDLHSSALEVEPAVSGAVGAELLHARYSSVFKAALREAVASLSRRERVALRLHTRDGLSVDKIGAIFHVHRSTAAKWVADAREKIREALRRSLRTRAGLATAEVESIGDALHRRTDLSLGRVLAESAGREERVAPA